MRALFAALILTLAPFGAALHAQTAPGEDAPGMIGRDTQSVEIPKPTDKAAPPRKAEGKPEGRSLEAVAAEPDRAKRLDALFAALKAAPDKDSAKSIADRIDIALAPSGSDTADVLMGRAAQAAQAKDYDLAIQLLDGVLEVAPDHLEAWNKRATIFYQQQDYADALVDLRQVVAREPRHYGAWSGIAIICKELGDEKHALEAARKALEAYPQFDQIGDMEKTLSISVEGRPI